ncbi:hypothetical protein K502DRAFT_361929 [Neoconidiobolus thromboides FSU 785]|nr:hypothetical protein K502DRAFT_361929 [Neoconidiobolus thromboides FSU 785]
MFKFYTTRNEESFGNIPKIPYYLINHQCKKGIEEEEEEEIIRKNKRKKLNSSVNRQEKHLIYTTVPQNEENENTLVKLELYNEVDKESYLDLNLFYLKNEEVDEIKIDNSINLNKTSFELKNDSNFKYTLENYQQDNYEDIELVLFKMNSIDDNSPIPTIILNYKKMQHIRIITFDIKQNEIKMKMDYKFSLKKEIQHLGYLYQLQLSLLKNNLFINFVFSYQCNNCNYLSYFSSLINYDLKHRKVQFIDKNINNNNHYYYSVVQFNQQKYCLISNNNEKNELKLQTIIQFEIQSTQSIIKLSRNEKIEKVLVNDKKIDFNYIQGYIITNNNSIYYFENQDNRLISPPLFQFDNIQDLFSRSLNINNEFKLFIYCNDIIYLINKNQSIQKLTLKLENLLFIWNEFIVTIYSQHFNPFLSLLNFNELIYWLETKNKNNKILDEINNNNNNNKIQQQVLNQIQEKREMMVNDIQYIQSQIQLKKKLLNDSIIIFNEICNRNTFNELIENNKESNINNNSNYSDLLLGNLLINQANSTLNYLKIEKIEYYKKEELNFWLKIKVTNESNYSIYNIKAIINLICNENESSIINNQDYLIYYIQYENNQEIIKCQESKIVYLKIQLNKKQAINQLTINSNLQYQLNFSYQLLNYNNKNYTFQSNLILFKLTELNKITLFQLISTTFECTFEYNFKAFDIDTLVCLLNNVLINQFYFIDISYRNNIIDEYNKEVENNIDNNSNKIDNNINHINSNEPNSIQIIKYYENEDLELVLIIHFKLKRIQFKIQNFYKFQNFINLFLNTLNRNYTNLNFKMISNS